MLQHWLKSGVVQLAVSAALTSFSPLAIAQTQLRGGVIPLSQISALAQRNTTTSQGSLAQLQIDPNFSGDFQSVYNYAARLLEGYRVVRRGGGFPENAGIPIDRQLTVGEVVYTVFALDNGNELFLYRSPTENTAQYFIRSLRG